MLKLKTETFFILEKMFTDKSLFNVVPALTQLVLLPECYYFNTENYEVTLILRSFE